MKSLLVSTLLLLISSMPLNAQDAATTLPPLPEPSTPAIALEELRAHVRWLSSDELEGRGTGTPSIDLAADYIAREFARYGLKPGGENGTYFQVFEVITGVASQRNALAMESAGARTPLDTMQFMPYSFSASGSFTGTPTFAGYGIVAEDEGIDDYENLDVRGRVVIVRDGIPADANPHSAVGLLATARSKELIARERGAAALLIIEDNETQLRKLRYDGSPSRAQIPVGRIGVAAAREILSAAGMTEHAKDMFGKGPAPRMEEPSALMVQGEFNVQLVSKKTRNVIGIVPGVDPAHREEAFVIGAHYDHLGWGQHGSLYRGSVPMIHNGADDNASGTAGVLELAQHFAAAPAARTLVFMTFSGEEMGLLGSAHWVSNPTIPIERIRAMFNLDMVGRLPKDNRRLNVQGIGTSPLWKPMVEKLNDTESFDLALIEDGHGASDHSSFYAKDIPVLFFFTGLHADYHRPSDDAHLLNYEGQTDVVRYVAEAVTAADAEDDIPFTRVKKADEQPVARFNVYVGTMPDYAYSGDGFRITGTSPGSPADKAGLDDGDVIVRFGETEVKNIYDYMTALSRHEPGEDVPVVVRRGEEQVTLTVGLVSK